MLKTLRTTIANPLCYYYLITTTTEGRLLKDNNIYQGLWYVCTSAEKHVITAMSADTQTVYVNDLWNILLNFVFKVYKNISVIFNAWKYFKYVSNVLNILI